MLKTVTTLLAVTLALAMLVIASMLMDMIVMVRLVSNIRNCFVISLNMHYLYAKIDVQLVFFLPQILMSVQSSLMSVSRYVTTPLVPMCVTAVLAMLSIVMEERAEVKTEKKFKMVLYSVLT